MSFLVWLIRTSGTAEREPRTGHLGDTVACRPAARSARTAATPDQERPPADQADGLAVVIEPQVPALSL
jgi:hypothetical protein